eukprot:TRINITY_DN6651_c0_g5_i1.p1 TRINITY_DN6651_c0_g5~~TRINITY_DN6651_c0_g5_i1.p1  ORF type:complete len:185 (+),score=26.07 TRINITY_DN6651_c0_g5_i1:58-612(+)
MSAVWTMPPRFSQNDQSTAMTMKQRKNSKKGKEKNFEQPRDTRYVATVVCVGEVPVLKVAGVGEFMFAYRNVKKRPGEPRALLAVGDTVECRLTTTPPQKAISIRILCGSGVPLAKNKPGSPGFPIAYEEDRKASQLSYNGNSSEGDTCSVHSVVESCLSLTDDGLEDEMEYSLGLSWVDNLLC